jgi:hypothetical protein
MSHPELEADLARALKLLAELGPLQVLDVHPTPPRRPAPPSAPAAAGPTHPSLFDPPELEPAPSTSTSTTDPDPLGHLPPHRRWREVLRHAGAPLSPTPSTWRSP